MFLVRGYLPGLMLDTRDPTGNKPKVLTSGRLSSVGTQVKKRLSLRVRCCGNTEKKHFSTEGPRSTPRGWASKLRSEVLVGITRVQGVGGRTTLRPVLKETDWKPTWTERLPYRILQVFSVCLDAECFSRPCGDIKRHWANLLSWRR